MQVHDEKYDIVVCSYNIFVFAVEVMLHHLHMVEKLLFLGISLWFCDTNDVIKIFSLNNILLSVTFWGRAKIQHPTKTDKTQTKRGHVKILRRPKRRTETTIRKRNENCISNKVNAYTRHNIDRTKNYA